MALYQNLPQWAWETKSEEEENEGNVLLLLRDPPRSSSFCKRHFKRYLRHRQDWHAALQRANTRLLEFLLLLANIIIIKTLPTPNFLFRDFPKKKQLRM